MQALWFLKHSGLLTPEAHRRSCYYHKSVFNYSVFIKQIMDWSNETYARVYSRYRQDCMVQTIWAQNENDGEVI